MWDKEKPHLVRTQRSLQLLFINIKQTMQNMMQGQNQKQESIAGMLQCILGNKSGTDMTHSLR